jgi:hypothetical protein
MSETKLNQIVAKAIAGFGGKWERFDQTGMTNNDSKQIFVIFFPVFSWNNLQINSVGFDIGCDSGWWAKFVGLRYVISQVVAALIYWPFVRFAKIAKFFGFDVKNGPLAPYKHCGFYDMRSDALDRFGTRLKQRFSRIEIQQMMESVGLERIVFSEKRLFWCAVGFARAKH